MPVNVVEMMCVQVEYFPLISISISNFFTLHIHCRAHIPRPTYDTVHSILYLLLLPHSWCSLLAHFNSFTSVHTIRWWRFESGLLKYENMLASRDECVIAVSVCILFVCTTFVCAVCRLSLATSDHALAWLHIREREHTELHFPWLFNAWRRFDSFFPLIPSLSLSPSISRVRIDTETLSTVLFANGEK